MFSRGVVTPVHEALALSNLASSINGHVYSDPFDEIPDFVSATVDTSATTLGIDDSRLTVTANEIFVNVAGLSFTSGTTSNFDIQFVPEPSTALLVGAGIAALARRREYPIA